MLLNMLFFLMLRRAIFIGRMVLLWIMMVNVPSGIGIIRLGCLSSVLSEEGCTG